MTLLLSTAIHAEIVHRERSLYSTILVSKSGSNLCLQFSVRRDQRNQSCMNTRYPRRMVFAYTKMTMASLMFVDNPSNILVVGLGGGTLPVAFRELFPTASIDAVEIDPAVTRVAKEYFDFNPEPNINVFDQDARVWTKRALTKDKRYDLIILDAFNGEYIPEHLMTSEYLSETKRLLTSTGTLAANTFSVSKLYDHESATYAAVFDQFINFQIPESANRLVVVPGKELTDQELLDAAEDWATRLKPYNVPVKKYARRLVQLRKKAPDWNVNARVLTDQYSPANLLQND
ncbi:MAG: fused MFS/spermidine synthase [Pseudomonadota bacterium]